MSHQKQKKFSQQKQIIGHNYVNNIFLSTLSTLQSLKLKIQNKHIESYKNKLFTHYDKVDYSSKSLKELQSQLQTHLTIFRASVKSYLEDYQQNWVPPSNFNTQAASNFITQALKLFVQMNDEICSRFTEDFIKIIQGNLQNLNIDQVQINLDYTEQEKINHGKNLLANSAHAQMIMEQQKERIQNQKIQHQSQLKANLNPNYGSPVIIKYLVAKRKYFDDYIKGHQGFAFQCLDSENIYVQQRKAAKSLRKNEVLVQLKICNDTVIGHRLVD